MPGRPNRAKKGMTAMSALEKIILWAKKDLPAWQSDAVRRFLLCDVLTAADKNQLYLLMKTHHGLAEKNATTPDVLLPCAEDFSGSAKPGETICLKSITCVANINAIPDATVLPIGHKGVTIIYGENGTGKSGFARALKRACNARDRKDEVLGNIFGNSTLGKPKVRFKLDINEKIDCIQEWEEGDKTSSTLSKITVFDSKCARVIIDDRNDYQYKFYGTHVFEELAKLCEELKQRLLSEKTQSLKPIIGQLLPNTVANIFFLNLGAKTGKKELSVFETWSDNDEKQLNTGKEWLDSYKQQNIDSKITSLKVIISKYVNLIRATRKVARHFSLAKIQVINSNITQLNAAEEAQRIAVEAVSSGDFPLPGVKGEAWRQLFEAAEKYSQQQAYPNAEFPNTDSDALCVLCMQALSEPAKQRMRSFKDFMLDEAGHKLKTAKIDLQNIEKKYGAYHLRDLKELSLSIPELESHDSQLSEAIIKAYSWFHELLKAFRGAIETKVPVKVTEQPQIVTDSIVNWLKSIRQQIRLGKYERAHYIGVNTNLREEERNKQLEQKEKDFISLILHAFRAEPVENFKCFHGKKAGRMTAVGPINLPVTRLFVEEIILECRSKRISRVDVLAFEFEMGLFPNIQEEAKAKGIDLAMKYIPREVFDKRAVEKNQVVFHDVSYIEVKPHVKKGLIAIELTDFSVYYSQDTVNNAAETLKEGKNKIVVENGKIIKVLKDKNGIVTKEVLTKKWTDWIDYWAVDFNFESKREIIRVQKDPTGGIGAPAQIKLDGFEDEQVRLGEWEEQWTGEYIFENEWQSFRTKNDRSLELKTPLHECEKGRYKIAVKVVDIFGNDTMKIIEVSV